MYCNNLFDNHKYFYKWKYFRVWNVLSFTLLRIRILFLMFIHFEFAQYIGWRSKHINTNANRKTNEKKRKKKKITQNPFLLLFVSNSFFFFSLFFRLQRFHCHAFFYNQYGSFGDVLTSFDLCGFRHFLLCAYISVPFAHIYIH